MREVRYEARPVGYDRARLNTWDGSERRAAIAWVQHRNSNPAQTPVRLIEVITVVSERKVRV